MPSATGRRGVSSPWHHLLWDRPVIDVLPSDCTAKFRDVFQPDRAGSDGTAAENGSPHQPHPVTLATFLNLNPQDATADSQESTDRGESAESNNDSPPILPDVVIVPSEGVDAEPNEPQTIAPSNPTTVSPGSEPLPIPVAAQSIGEVSSVVTANRAAQSGSSVASSMTVISSEAIRNSGQTDVADVLRNVVGVDVARSGGFGQLSTVFLRGANGNQTKVLMDGMPVNDPGSAGRAFDFSFLTVDSIERIEVLRGPQSTLYGSDAIGGVINIITKRGAGPPQSQTSASGGSYQTFRGTTSVSGGNDDAYYYIAGGYFNTDGFSASSRGPNNSEDDGYSNKSVSGRVGWNVAPCLNLDMTFRHFDAETEIDSIDFFAFPSVPQDSDSFITQKNTFVRGTANLDLFDNLWEQRIGVGYVQYDRNSVDPFGGPFYGRQNRLDWTNNLDLYSDSSNQLILSGGGDYTEELGRNNSIGRVRQDDLGGYATLRATLADVMFLTGGMRWDEYTYAGDAVTYRATGRVDLTSTAAMHGAIGTGFRAPALAELFDPFVGNTNLQNETSKGWEAGMQLSSSGGCHVWDITYFRNDIINLIQFDFATFLLENVGSALASGVEATWNFRISDSTNGFLNYTFNDTRNRDTGFQLLRRPKNKVSLGLNRMFEDNRANLSCAMRYIDARTDTQNFVTGSYIRADLAGWYQVSRCCRAFARIDNVFNEQYEEVLGFATTDFAVYAGLETTLGR